MHGTCCAASSCSMWARQHADSGRMWTAPAACLQGLDKSGSAQGDLILGVQLPDGLKGFPHHCRWNAQRLIAVWYVANQQGGVIRCCSRLFGSVDQLSKQAVPPRCMQQQRSTVQLAAFA